MPIVVSHQPPMELLARAGWYVGAGEERQRREEMEQRERMQMRGIEANLISQQMSYQQQMQRDVMGAELQAQRDVFQAQHAVDRMAQQEELRQRAAQIRQEERNEALMQRQKAQNEAAAGRFRDQQEWDQTKFFIGQADDTLRDISDQLGDGMGFETDAQQQEYQSKLAEIDKIRNNPSLRPVQRAQAMYELASRLPIPSKRIPTTREQMEEQIIMRPDPNDPSRMVEWTVDRNGLPSVAREPETKKPEQDDSFEREQVGMKAYNEAYKLLTKTEKGKLGDSKTIPPTHEEVVKYLTQQQKFARGQSGGEAPQEPAKPAKKRKLKFDPATGSLTEVK
jgi:hypothetical protein